MESNGPMSTGSICEVEYILQRYFEWARALRRNLLRSSSLQMARRVPASSEFEKSMTFPSKVDILVSHISKHLSLVPERPLFVAIQGPQGSGKSYLTSLVQSTLTSPPAKLNVAALSIDDLYLPHRSLTALAKTHPENHLLKGRGQPGTHDVSLGAEILDALKLGLHAVELPRFDKSLFNGEGDRLPIDGTGIIIHPPVDVVIMEGWCMGFSPISDQELGLRFSTSWQEEISTLGLTAIGSISRESIRQLNASLSDYKRLWSFFDVFIQVSMSQMTRPLLDFLHFLHS